MRQTTFFLFVCFVASSKRFTKKKTELISLVLAAFLEKMWLIFYMHIAALMKTGLLHLYVDLLAMLQVFYE